MFSKLSTLPVPYLINGLHGIERETIRLNPQGNLSQVSHEKALGVALGDAHFTVDFAECQLEIVTDPAKDLPSLLKNFTTLHEEVINKLNAETLWLYSMPPLCEASEIKLAYQESTDASGQEKYLYRKGLCQRYGKMMQTISGIHYNFSFDPRLFPLLGLRQDQAYFKMIRNFWRFYPILIYLFGASPLCYENSLKPHVNDQEFLTPIAENRYVGPAATSLRLSELGYHNPDVPNLRICYQTLDTYLETLQRQVSTVYEPYLKIPAQNQLNAFYLQQEGEHYAPIRPKANPAIKKRSLQALKESGIHYLEVRTLDLNPLLPLGFEIETLAFIDLFLIYCLLEEDHPFDFVGYKKMALEVAKFGRENTRIIAEGSRILKAISPIVTHLNNPLYIKALKIQEEKLHDPQKLPSYLVLKHFL